MVKSGPSAAAGTKQLRRSLASGAVPSARERANRATAGKVTHGTGDRSVQRHYNSVIKNHQFTARSMDKRKASKTLKLSSATMGQTWDNVGAVGTRFGRGPKPSNSTADKRRAGRHEGSKRGAAPAKHSRWPKKSKQPVVYMAGGFAKRQVSTQKRSPRVQQHPLTEAFTGGSILALPAILPVDRAGITSTGILLFFWLTPCSRRRERWHIFFSFFLFFLWRQY